MKPLQIVFTKILVVMCLLGCQKDEAIELESPSILNDTISFVDTATETSLNARSIFTRNYDIRRMHLQSIGSTYDGRQISVDWNGTFKKGPGFSASNIWYFYAGTLTIAIDGMSTISFEHAPSLAGSSAFRYSYVQGIDRLSNGKDFRKYNFYLVDLILPKRKLNVNISGTFSNTAGSDPYNHYIRVGIKNAYTGVTQAYYQGTPRITRFD